MRFLLSLLLLAGFASAVEPYVGIGAIQPLASEMHAIYHLMPGASLGVRFPRTRTLAFRVSGAGALGSGRGAYGEFRLVSATLGLGVELHTNSALGAYVVPAIVAGYGAERMPDADTLGNIFDRWDSGTGLGFSIDAGATLFRTGALQLDAECGLRFLSVPTDRATEGGWYPYYESIDVSTFGVGLVARFVRAESDPGRQ
jgi:hypothetical protein